MSREFAPRPVSQQSSTSPSTLEERWAHFLSTLDSKSARTGSEKALRSTPVAVNPQATAKEWIGLAVLALPTLLVSIDVSLMILALPRIGQSLGASSTELLWIMDIYGFMLAGFLITMGTLGDRVGRRKLLLIGASGFGAASLLAAFSVSPLMLIVARALLGIAGATLSPSILALIGNMFKDPRQRAVAISVWLTCFMSGMAIGPVVGGAMLEVFWWGSVFLLGVPVTLILLVAGRLLLPEYRDTSTGQLDLPSVALSLGTILPLVYALKESAAHGLSASTTLSAVIGVGFGVLFVKRQNNLADPLLDLRLFGNRGFSVALVSMAAMTSIGANMLFFAQYFQLVEGLSPLHAGLWMLPGVGAGAVGFLLSPRLARRVRPAQLIVSGLLLAAFGFAFVAATSAGLYGVVLGWVLMNLGCAPLVTLGTDFVIGSAPLEKAGSAAAMSETGTELGFALGIAVLGSLGTAIYRAALPAGMPPEARESLASATALAASLPDSLAEPLLLASRQAFVSGMQGAAALSVAILLVVATLVVLGLRHVQRIGEPRPADTSLAAAPACA